MSDPGQHESMALWTSWNGPPWVDLAREEMALKAARRRAVLFLYAWDHPVLVLGYGQRPGGEVDLAYCRKARIPVLRRCTGGTAVYNQGDLSIALAFPAEWPWARTIHGLYDRFVETVRDALGGLEVETSRWKPADGTPAKRSPICFEDHATESLLVGGRKVLGCAQVRRKEAVLVHGTLLFSLDPERQARVYNVEPARIERAMAALPALSGLAPESIARPLADLLASRLGSTVSREEPPRPTGDLLERGSDPKWTLLPDAPSP